MADEITTTTTAPAADATTTPVAANTNTPPAAPTQPLSAAGALGADTPAGTDKPADAEPANALTMPGKDATPEQWGEFYAQLGRPETPEGYELPLPEGDDGAFAKQVAPLLHKHGLSAEQAKGLAGDWNEMVASMAKQDAEAQAAHNAQMHAKNTAEAASLKTEWGQQHDANMEFARRAVRQFMGDQAGDVIAAIESKIGYKATIQMLHGIGKGLGEHDAPGMGQNNSGVSQKTLAERFYGPDQPQQ